MLAAALLAACATAAPIGTQTVTEPGTVRLERGAETYLLDVSGAIVGSRSLLADVERPRPLYCAMAVSVRADGTVSSVKMLGSRSDQMELTCRRSAYDWRVLATRDDAPVALDGVRAAIVVDKNQRLGETVVEQRVFAARVVFDTAEIEALRTR